EARVGAQGVKQGMRFPPDEKFRIALLIGLSQKGEGLILFPQARIDGCEVAPGDMPSFGVLLQFGEQLARFGALACTRVGMPEPGLVHGEVWREGYSPLKFGNRFCKLSLSHIRESQEMVRVGKIGVDFERLPQLLDRQIVSSQKQESPSTHGVDDERKRVELLGLLDLGQGFLVPAQFG